MGWVKYLRSDRAYEYECPPKK